MKTGDLVLPGQEVGVIEMFVPGNGTYTDKEGRIYASVVGEVEINQDKKVSVIPKDDKPALPKYKESVVGIIKMVRKQMAIADINNNLGFNPTTDFEGMIHISQVSKTYLNNLSDAFKVGDVVRGEIINETVIPFHLTTAASNLGVILAYCSECGDVLKLDQRRLRCERCNIIERRKIANDYGKYKL